MNITVNCDTRQLKNISINASIRTKDAVLFNNTFCVDEMGAINIYCDWPFNEHCYLTLSTDSHKTITIVSIIFDDFWNLKSVVENNNKLDKLNPLRYDIIRPIAKMVFRYE